MAEHENKKTYMMSNPIRTAEIITDKNFANTEQLRLLAQNSLRINKLETSEAVINETCLQVKEIIGKGYVVGTLMHDSSQTLSVKAAQGFEDDRLVSTILHLTGTDLFKIQYPVNDLTPEELSFCRSGHLELSDDGLYTILIRKFPRAVCTAVESLLGIRFVYSMGLVHRHIHLGSIVIASVDNSTIEASEFIIEDLVAQAAAAISRIHTEISLRENEERYYNLSRITSGFRFSSIKTGENDFTLEWITGVIEEITGYSPEEVLQRAGWGFMVHADDSPIFKQSITSLFPGDGHSCELRIIHKNGSVRWLKASSRVVADELSAGYRLFGGCEDITERKRAEEALQLSEDKYRVLFNSGGNDGIFVHHPDEHFMPGMIIEANDALIKLLGYSREELLKMRVPDFLEYQDPSEITSFMQILKQKECIVLERVYITRDSRKVPVEVSSRLFTYGGRATVVSIVRDTTERKKTEMALKKSKERLSRAEQIAGLGHWELDLTRQQIKASKEALNIYGVQGEDIPMKEIQALRFQEYGEMLDDALNGLIKRNESFNVEYKIIRPTDGKIIDIHSIAEYDPIRNIVFGVIQDVTERKQAEDRIKAALAEKDVLLKEIHHRVKNNMQVIASLLNLQSAHVADQRDVGLFLESQDRINSMALVYNKLYQSNDLASIGLRDYVTDLVNDLLRSYALKSGSCRAVTEVADVRLSLDLAIPCGLIINEAITNSLKYAFPGGRKGTIFVNIVAPDGRLEMLLGDDGIGLPPDMNPATTPTLGMQLIYTLTEHQLGGTVEMESGSGARYRITFPRV
jgi:PAS domain S-box-containing protein